MALLLLTIVPSAAAAPPDPAVEQYVERVPGADGDQPTTGREPGPRELPGPVKRRIQTEGGEDVAALEAVAGSPALGAPAPNEARAHGEGARTDRRDGRDGRQADETGPSTLGAAAGAPLHGDGGTVVLLLGGLAMVTAVAGALARRRRGSGVD